MVETASGGEGGQWRRWAVETVGAGGSTEAVYEAGKEGGHAPRFPCTKKEVGGLSVLFGGRRDGCGAAYRPRDPAVHVRRGSSWGSGEGRQRGVVDADVDWAWWEGRWGWRWWCRCHWPRGGFWYPWRRHLLEWLSGGLVVVNGRERWSAPSSVAVVVVFASFRSVGFVFLLGVVAFVRLLAMHDGYDEPSWLGGLYPPPPIPGGLRMDSGGVE
ncbi:hypothetical protein BDZ97DRAFT_1762156 [Flammula alnicola]|nr:hypothetical protein BDZ97DRAFT_1762156 [Flammula alnicola]